MLFTHKKGLIPNCYFEKLYVELKDKCFNFSSKKRKSCIFNLHSLDLLDYIGYDIKKYPCDQLLDSISEIRTIVEKETGYIYDYVLVHIYEDGDASIAYHNDKEALSTMIASVSLGATRKFRFREIGRKAGYDYELNLSSGDMVLMHIGCQQKYFHSVPVEKKVKTPRINLTFRQYDI